MKPRHFPSAALNLSSAAFLLLGLLVACAAPALAQEGSRAVQGVWVNVDSSSRSLTMMEVQGNRIHLYGQCHPQPCTWGILKAKPFLSTANANPGLQASVHQGSANKSFTLAVDPDGRLRVELFIHFKADSLSDYRIIEYFVRGRSPRAN